MPKRYLRRPDGTLVEYSGGSGGDISREEFNQLSEAIGGLDGLTYGIYVGDTQPTNKVMYWLDISEDTEEESETPVEPDEPNIPEDITLSSISATYTGGSVTVGTSVNSLTEITVKATYSDGSTANVTDYTLSGTIAEGENTITVSYGGKTTTFKVTGVAESSGSESGGTETVLITDVAVETMEGYNFVAKTDANGDWVEICSSNSTMNTYKVTDVRTGDVLVSVAKNTTDFGYGKIGENNAVSLTGTKAFKDNYSWCTVTWTADQDYDYVWVNALAATVSAHSDAMTWTREVRE